MSRTRPQSVNPVAHGDTLVAGEPPEVAGGMMVDWPADIKEKYIYIVQLPVSGYAMHGRTGCSMYRHAKQ